MSLLYEKNLKMVPKTTDIVLPFNQQNISVMQHKLQYNTGMLQCKKMQYDTGGTVPTILAVNTISNTGKIAKRVHPDSFGEEQGSK